MSGEKERDTRSCLLQENVENGTLTIPGKAGQGEPGVTNAFETAVQVGTNAIPLEKIGKI